MAYEVEVLPSAIRELQKLPRQAFTKALPAIIGLATTPRPPAAKALAGEALGTLRTRIGDYRIIYSVDDKERTVTVYRIAHRREAYR